MAKSLQLLQNFIFLFLKSFGYVDNRAKGIFSLVSWKMERFSLIFDFFLLVLFFAVTICIVDNKFKFFWFFAFVLILNDAVIFEYIIGIKSEWELFSEFRLSGLEPWVLSYFFHFKSFLGVDLKDIADQLFAFLSNIGFFGKSVLALTDELDDLRGVGAVEGKRAKQQIVQDDSTCPDIDCGGIAFLFGWEDLWGHVLKSACIKVGIELIGHTTDSKVGNLDEHFLSGLEKDVFYFQVTMNDVFAMTVRHCAGYLPEVVLGLLLRNDAFFS